MARLRPGWLVVVCATVILVSAWLPWLTTTTDGGGRASAIGGRVGQIAVPPHGFGVGQLIVILTSTLMVAAAMSARNLSPRSSSAAALGISVLLAVMTLWYYRLYVGAPVAAGYGFYIGVVTIVIAIALSVLAMVVAWGAR
ncbi:MULTISPECIES: hypothetical protein [unclassified Mycobacterium]|uniref:hypothetical protein n=1 Tax=unclassified Mycobacterium TaxID=2642494 RepID=UPI0029C90BE4|nr:MULTISPECIES: hypothetical protein [unclassified Mycobacterium]